MSSGLREEVGITLKDMMPGLFGKRRRQRFTVAEAREILKQQEAEKLIDQQQVAAESTRRVEQGGTIFLDEVVDLPKSVQVKLLRVLQEGTFERVGGEETVSVNVRVISAANRDLKREVERKNFREDLYYRLNVVPVALPPLRERKNDIPLLAEKFLQQAAKEGQKTAGLSKETVSIMMDYPWPGNVRELQNAIHYCLVKCKGRVIRPKDLPLEMKSRTLRRGPRRKLNPDSVRAAMELSGGNKAKAARRLGVGRATLYRFLEEFPDVS